MNLTLTIVLAILLDHWLGEPKKNHPLIYFGQLATWFEIRLLKQLDMSFREDESRMRKGHSAENFAVMRHVALSLLKRDKSFKLGVKNKRLRAGWDDKYLTKLLISS